MKNFALLNDNNVVVNISVADEKWDSTGWIEYTENNPAYIGGDYVDGYFYSVQPYPSWTRNIGKWEAPISKPTQGFYKWDEENLMWQKFAN